MTAKTKDQIKAFFQTGDKPTEAQFIDFIDSYVDMAGPMGTIQTAASAGSQGFAFCSGGHGEVLSGANALTFMGATVVTTAAVSGVTVGLTATTAQANAGTATGVLMNPVLVKNAITALGIGELVLLVTKTASVSASLDFTSAMSSAYSSYLVVFNVLACSTTASIGLNASSNNGVAWTQDFNSQKSALTLAGTVAPTYTGVSGTHPALITTSYASGIISGHAIISVNGANTFSWKSSLVNATTGVAADEVIIFSSGNINAIQIIPSAGTFTSGTVYLYGIKNT